MDKEGAYIVTVTQYFSMMDMESTSIVGLYKNKQNAIKHLYGLGLFPTNSTFSEFESIQPSYKEELQNYDYTSFEDSLTRAKITYKTFSDNL